MGEEKPEDAETPEATVEDPRDAKIRELTSTLQYLQAEYENLRKRTAKDMENFARYSQERLVLRLLPVLDDLELSIGTIEDEGVCDGLRLIYRNLMKALKEEGLEEIDALGREFDPFVHEAVMEVDEPEKRGGEVVEVVQKGYRLRSKVIRPSKVKVAKQHPEEGGETDG